MGRERYTNLNGNRNVNSFNDLLKWRRERRMKKKDLSYIVPQASDKRSITYSRIVMKQPLLGSDIHPFLFK